MRPARGRHPPPQARCWREEPTEQPSRASVTLDSASQVRTPALPSASSPRDQDSGPERTRGQLKAGEVR